jgi:hypothetical protein
MLSTTLNYDKPINMDIALMRALVEIKNVKVKLHYHDSQLNPIYEAMENHLD